MSKLSDRKRQRRTETHVDFLDYLGKEVSMKILSCLDDPYDIVRVSSVSKSWRRFVIVNRLSRQLCVRVLPYLSRVDSIVESPVKVLPSDWEILKTEHRAYAFLAHCITISFPPPGGIIVSPISASSTHHNNNGIYNTMEPKDRVSTGPSYWSSKGQSNPNVPETLVYKLASDVCVITEISLRPFAAYFQYGSPIYSAKSVRFRMGHPKVRIPNQPLNEGSFIWTYTSQEFPMAQENRLQKFVLPEPVLCVGGVLQIDLLGRAQRQAKDGLFYIRMTHVEAQGQLSPPAFAVESLKPATGNFGLRVLSYDKPSLIKRLVEMERNLNVEYEYEKSPYNGIQTMGNSRPFIAPPPFLTPPSYRVPPSYPVPPSFLARPQFLPQSLAIERSLNFNPEFHDRFIKYC